MSVLALRLVPEVMRSIGFASIGATYMGIGAAFDHPIRIFFLQNLTNATLLFSFDGVIDHFVLPQNGYLLIDVTTNQTFQQGCFMAEGQRIYVKQSDTPTSGSVYLSVFYASKG